MGTVATMSQRRCKTSQCSRKFHRTAWSILHWSLSGLYTGLCLAHSYILPPPPAGLVLISHNPDQHFSPHQSVSPSPPTVIRCCSVHTRPCPLHPLVHSAFQLRGYPYGGPLRAGHILSTKDKERAWDKPACSFYRNKLPSEKAQLGLSSL